MVGPGHSKHSEKIGFKYFVNHAAARSSNVGKSESLPTLSIIALQRIHNARIDSVGKSQ